ncbi:HAD-IIA family hydrolase [Poriferisphaera sp. WC338]|uniref:HAD-IIA family hydrolase n=1 Tax=Poriferisphaera sp. WC338 TaxID=3425129 RepID=UPI003D814DBB
MNDGLKKKLEKIKHVVLDMDGTIYSGGTLFDFSKPFLAGLRKRGMGYTFLTNNCSRSVGAYLEKLAGLGIAASEENLLTSMHAMVFYLRKHHGEINRVFVLGTDGLKDDLRVAGLEVVAEGCVDELMAKGVKEEPEAVVVGFDTGMTYEQLCEAGWWIKRGKLFLATHPDVFCPTDERTVLVDCGAVTKCLEVATGVKADEVLGKPHEYMIAPILEKHGLKGEEVMMVGDRLMTDVMMGKRAGAVSVLVLTGDSTEEDVKESEVMPDVVTASLETLGKLIVEAGHSIHE